MAHGRTGPDIVMTTRYVGMPEIRTLTEHEENRTPDGTSAIDPHRTDLNVILHGPETQQEAVDALFDREGVQRPAKQAEAPFVQMVLSASPEYFRTQDQGPGEWHAGRLREWRQETMKWLKEEYGRDLLHVSLHLDEDTPHLHILIVPTYDKKPRRPGRKKRNESDQEFEARKAAAENAPTIRVAGRSSNTYWKKKFCRQIARQSYHKVMEPLGIGYGKDFVGEGEPSPERKETGTWVREQAAAIHDERAKIDAEWKSIDLIKAQNNRIRAENDKISSALDQREGFLMRVVERVWSIAEAVAAKFGFPLPEGIDDALRELEDAVNDYNQDLSSSDFSSEEDSPDNTPSPS
jgi:hypothetical protein